MKIITIQLIFLFSGILFIENLSAQTNRIETTDYLFWQPETKLKYTDFQNSHIADELPNASIIYNVQILTVLEYPANSSNFRSKDAKWYLAPAFNKVFSVFPAPNEDDLKLAQLYFDLSEYWARISRKRIVSLQEQIVKNDFNIAAFYRQELEIEMQEPAIKDFTEKLSGNPESAFAEIFKDIIEVMFMQREQMGMDLYLDSYLNNKPQVIAEWRKKIDILLESAKAHTTNITECKYFTDNKSLGSSYRIIFESKNK